MVKEVEQLADEARSGKMESLEELIDRMYPLLSSCIRKGGWNPQEREDLLQEGRLGLMEALKEYDPEKGVPVLGFLSSRLRYLYLGMKRPQAVMSLNESYGEDEDEFLDLLESDIDTLEDIVGAETISEVRKAVSSLPEVQQRVIVDLFYNGLSLSETAGVNGIAYRTVVNTRAAALKNLRNILGDRI
jgi:RNA polymerase sporulation-specific sigma factor